MSFSIVAEGAEGKYYFPATASIPPDTRLEFKGDGLKDCELFAIHSWGGRFEINPDCEAAKGLKPIDIAHIGVVTLGLSADLCARTLGYKSGSSFRKRVRAALEVPAKYEAGRIIQAAVNVGLLAAAGKARKYKAEDSRVCDYGRQLAQGASFTSVWRSAENPQSAKTELRQTLELLGVHGAEALVAYLNLRGIFGPGNPALEPTSSAA